MSSTFNLEIITPERRFYSGDVEMIILKTPQGEMGVLPMHIPMVVEVAVGPIRIKTEGEWKEAVLTEGFMEIRRDGVIILADTAEWPHEIDISRAEAAKKRAAERLERQMAQVEYIRSKAALARAVARIKAGRTVK